MTALSLEACGVVAPGTATPFTEQEPGLSGIMLITTFGGLKARGHPVGATGIYQLMECFLQLTDTAGKNQAHGAHTVMSQNLCRSCGGRVHPPIDRCNLFVS